MITFPVANTSYSLRNDIKDTLSTMSEKFARSKYFIEDINKGLWFKFFGAVLKTDMYRKVIGVRFLHAVTS